MSEKEYKIKEIECPKRTILDDVCYKHGALIIWTAITIFSLLIFPFQAAWNLKAVQIGNPSEIMTFNETFVMWLIGELLVSVICYIKRNG